MEMEYLDAASSSRGNKKVGQMCDFPNCKEVAMNRCSKCKVFGYCTWNHLLLDLTHQKQCPVNASLRKEEWIDDALTSALNASSDSNTTASPCWEFEQDSDNFRVVASMDLIPGTVIRREEAIVSFPNVHYNLPYFRNTHNELMEMLQFTVSDEHDDSDYYYQGLFADALAFYPPPKTAQICFNCFAVESKGLKYRCGKCEIPLCSEKCENGAIHTQECEFLQSIRLKIGFHHRDVESLYMDIATLRTLFIKNSTPLVFDQILSLKHHRRVQNFKKSAKYNVLLSSNKLPSVLPISLKYCHSDTLLAIDVCSITEALSNVYSSQTSRKSLYLFIGSLQHGCVPNCIYMPCNETFEKNTSSEVEIIATNYIKAGDVLTIDVLNQPLYTSRYNRHMFLQSKFIFECDCDFCLDPTDSSTFLNAVRCDKCLFYLLPLNPGRCDLSVWMCENCGEGMQTWNRIQDDIKKAKLELKSISVVYSNIDKFVELRKKFLLYFHPNHYIILTVEGILAKLALGFSRNCWGSVKALTHLHKLTPDMAKDYNFVVHYCYQLLRFLRVGYALERGLILRQLFYIEFLFACQNYECSYENLQQYYHQFRILIFRLKESGLIFLKHKHPCRQYVGKKTMVIVSYFEEKLSLAKKLRNWNVSYSGKCNRMRRIKLDRILQPIVTQMLTPDPINENFII